jgi:short-subunit dehydrogenase
MFSKLKKKGHGHLVGISSIASLRGNRYCPSYSASKAFQANYLEALRCIAKNEKLNLKITDVQPGLVDTPMAKGEGLFWGAPVKKASNQIYSAILKQKKKFT